jgi:hypothetical protein
MADDQPERDGNQRRNRHRRRCVLQMLQVRTPSPTGPTQLLAVNK